MLVFGSVDSHHFSSVVDHFWCRVSSVWAHDVGHQDTVLTLLGLHVCLLIISLIIFF